MPSSSTIRVASHWSCKQFNEHSSLMNGRRVEQVSYMIIYIYNIMGIKRMNNQQKFQHEK